jgi:hypothetical protein
LVSKINVRAFSGCSNLKTVTIPATIKAIDHISFFDCTSLTSFVMLSSNPYTAIGDPFTSSSKVNCTLYVPAGTKEAFAAVPSWQGFKEIIELPRDKRYTQTIELQKGLNLVSFNLSPANKSIDSVFWSVMPSLREVKSTTTFYSTALAHAFNSLDSISDGAAYLVNMSEPASLVISATDTATPAPTTLARGWNLLGCPFQTRTPFVEGLDKQGFKNPSNIGAIKNFEGFWIPNATTHGIDSFEPGKGYFVLIKD